MYHFIKVNCQLILTSILILTIVFRISFSVFLAFSFNIFYIYCVYDYKSFGNI